MDKKVAETIYQDPLITGRVEYSFEGLSSNVEAEHETYVDNTITMANHWIGISGDNYLGAANTIAAYLARTMYFFAKYSELLGDYQFDFKSVDEVLSKNLGVEEK